jgi:hypothetical protein
MALTTAQQALLLFKKLLGLGQTTASREFFNETSFPGRSAVYTNQIWTEQTLIPNTAPVLTSGQSSSVVQYWEDVTLGAVPGTTTAFTSSLLIDAIPFNYGDGTSYNYTLKDNLNNGIAFGQGDWIVDTDAGLVTFYSTVPANMPPKISFYKYVGAKGFTSPTVPITGSLFGTASFAVNATSASAATSITFIPATASFAVTASYVAGASSDWDSIANKPAGLVSSSAQINTGSFSGSFAGTLTGTSSFATSASYVLPSGLPVGTVSSSAQVSYTSLQNIPSGIVSSSSQINTGSFTGSFTGPHTGSTFGTASNAISSSFATTASAATSITFIPATASFAVTASYVSGAASNWDSISNKPSGLLSSSTQINQLANVSASFATTASAANSITFTPLSASLGINNIITASAVNTTITFTKGDGTQFNVTIAQSGSVQSASFATFATSASTALSVNYTDIVNIPALVSSSAQINTGSFTGSFTGPHTGSTFGTASNAVSASYALSASFAPTVLPNGIVSSSAQINTGSFSGSFTGTLTGTSSWAVSASYIIPSGLPIGTVSSSAQVSYTGLSNIPVGIISSSTQINALVGVSASFATLAATASFVDYANVANKPTLVSSSAQINTGSFSGSFIGSLIGTSSWAISASYAPGSPSISASFADTSISSSYALTASYALNGGSGGGGGSGSSAVTIDRYTFDADGSTVNYVVSQSYDISSLFISVNGLTYINPTDYTVVSNTITFVAPPVSQSYVVIRALTNVTSAATGSFSGSFFGNILSSSFATTASFAVSASWAPSVSSTMVPIQDEGILVVSTPVALNFIGSGVTVTNTSNTASITIPGGSGGDVPVKLISASYSFTSSAEFIFTSGSFTVTLPSAIGISGREYQIKNISTGEIFITGSQTIDTYSDITIAEKNTALGLISNGTNWSIF